MKACLDCKYVSWGSWEGLPERVFRDGKCLYPMPFVVAHGSPLLVQVKRDGDKVFSCGVVVEDCLTYEKVEDGSCD